MKDDPPATRLEVILLCAGFGTRLLPLTRHTPKALLQVAGRPVLDYLMDQVVTLPELDAVHLVVNGTSFGDFYAWKSDWHERLRTRGIELHLYSDGALRDEDRRGAAGDLAFVCRGMKAPARVLVSAGDNIYRFALETLWSRLVSSEDNYVLALPERKRQHLSVLDVDKEMRVRGVYHGEKPPSKWVCPELYALQPAALVHLNDFLNSSDEHDMPGYFIDYVARRETVYALPQETAGVRLHISTRYMYQKANTLLQQEEVRI